MLASRMLRRYAGAVVGIAALCSGCLIGIGDGGGDGGGGTPEKIRVTVVNQSGITLDPEIYKSAAPVTVEELFADGNKFTAFGVGTLGLLGPGGSDTFTLTCEEARVIGTRGGRFGDNQNNPDGFGQQIVLAQDLSVFCGGTLTIVYSRRPGGGFQTNHTVTR